MLALKDQLHCLKGKSRDARTLNFAITVLNCVVIPLLLVVSTFRREATLKQAFSCVHLASLQL